jgi:hypothetical protein
LNASVLLVSPKKSNRALTKNICIAQRHILIYLFWKIMKKSLYAVNFIALFLTACGGGGGGGGGGGNPDTASASSTSAAAFGDCFVLTPGVKFLKSNGYKELNVQETFEGQTAFGRVELRSDDTRFGAFYQTISGGFLHILGSNDYTQQGAFAGKQVYSSGYQFPLDMVPGQTVQVAYTNTTTSVQTGTTSTSNKTDQLTFIGFENLTLAGHTFSNVCKVSAPGTVNGRTDIAWFAKDYGVIKSESLDAQGVTVAGTTITLTSIVTAP